MSTSVWNDYEQGGVDYDRETNSWYYINDYVEYENGIHSALIEAFQEPDSAVSIIDNTTGNQIGTVEVSIEDAVAVDINTLYTHAQSPLDSVGYYSVGEIYPDAGSSDNNAAEDVLELLPAATASESNGASDKPQHPEAVVQEVVTAASGQMKTATETVKVILAEKANGLKTSATATLQLADGLAEGIIEFEEGYMPEKYARYYAENLDELKKTVDTVHTEAMKLYEKHGDLAGKSYAAGMFAKILGGVGTAADWVELGKRYTTAKETGDLDPVYGQTAKMVTAFAAGLATVGVARSAGLLLTAALGGGAVAGATGVVVTFIAAGALTFVISEAAGYLDAQISKGKLSSLFEKEHVEELAVVGNINYTGNTALNTDHATLIGKHHFENLEINSKDLMVVGEIDSDHRFIINSETTEVINQADIADFMKGGGSNAATEETAASAESNGAQDAQNADVPPEANGKIAAAAENDRAISRADWEALNEFFDSGSFDVAGAHMRMLDGAATAEDLNHLAAYQEWLYYQPIYADTAMPSAAIPDIAPENPVQ